MIEVNEQLAYIKHFLKKEKPSIADVVECYLTAADLYLQQELMKHSHIPKSRRMSTKNQLISLARDLPDLRQPSIL